MLDFGDELFLSLVCAQKLGDGDYIRNIFVQLLDWLLSRIPFFREAFPFKMEEMVIWSFANIRDALHHSGLRALRQLHYVFGNSAA